jgi:hypothetical protein
VRRLSKAKLALGALLAQKRASVDDGRDASALVLIQPRGARDKEMEAGSG